MPAPASEVAWRVASVLTHVGESRERHAFRDLSGLLAEALCKYSVATDRLEPDDPDARLCPLCWLFFGTDLADWLGVPQVGE